MLSTRDYSIFKKHECNRIINQYNLERIKNSIASNNLTRLRPIIVDKMMRVIDGQHRLEACRLLNEEIYYIIEELQDESMIELNTNQRPWRIPDYLNYYCERKNQNYIKVSKFCDENNIEIFIFITFFSKDKSCSLITKQFESGKFIFPEEAELEILLTLLQGFEKIKNLIKRFSSDNLSFLKTRKFKEGVFMLLKHELFNMDAFTKKVELKFLKIRVCNSKFEYYEMLRDIHNWRSNAPID